MEYEPPTPFESLTDDIETIEKRKKKKRDSKLPLIREPGEGEKPKAPEAKPPKEPTPEIIKGDQADTDEKIEHGDGSDTDDEIEKRIEEDDSALTPTPELVDDTIEDDEDDVTPTIPPTTRPPSLRVTPRSRVTPVRPAPVAPAPPIPPPPAGRGPTLPPTPPPRPLVPPVGGGAGGGLPPRPPVGANVIPSTPNIAPNVLVNPHVTEARAERLGYFVLGLLAGGVFEHYHHKRREKRREREHQKTERAHRIEKADLHSELDQQQRRLRQVEVERREQHPLPRPEAAPLPSEISEKEAEQSAATPTHELRPELPVDLRSGGREQQPVVAETSAEFGRIEQRDTTPEVLAGQQDGHGLGGGAGSGQSARPGGVSSTQSGRQGLEPKSSPFQPLGRPVHQAQLARPLIITSAIAFVVTLGFLVWLLIR